MACEVPRSRVRVREEGRLITRQDIKNTEGGGAKGGGGSGGGSPSPDLFSFCSF